MDGDGGAGASSAADYSVVVRVANVGLGPVFWDENLPLIGFATADGLPMRTTLGCDVCTCGECAQQGCAVCGYASPFVAVLEPGEFVERTWMFSHYPSVETTSCDGPCVRPERAPGDSFIAVAGYGHSFTSAFGNGVQPNAHASEEIAFSVEDRDAVLEIVVEGREPTVDGVRMQVTRDDVEWSATHVRAASVDADGTLSIVGIGEAESWMALIVPGTLGVVSEEQLRVFIDDTSGWTGRVELSAVEDDRVEGTFDLTHPTLDGEAVGSFVAPRL